MADTSSLATVSVTTSATAIIDTAEMTGADGGSTFEIYNEDATNAVNIGGSNVTVATGIPLAAGTSKQYVLKPGQTLYGIGATTVVVRRFRINN